MPKVSPLNIDSLLAAQRMGDWLRGFEWDHFVTLTFDSPVSPAGALAAFARWHRWIVRSAGHTVPYYVVVESGSLGAGLHLHVLTAGTTHLPGRLLAQAWKHGHTRVLVYDASRGASHYLTKQVPHGAEWDMSSSLPSMRNAA